MSIPLAKPFIGTDEINAATEVLASGNLAQGEHVELFEHEFSALIGSQFAVAVNSGTSALHLMLLASGLGMGDDVIVPSFTFAATANAVALTGATPVFADIDPFHFCVTPETILEVATPRTKAVLPVHLYGKPCNMPALEELCASESWLLFEDAAQAHLASIGGKRVGAWGEAAAFSFYPTKNMTTGEGGIVTTSDQSLARRMRLLRNQGMEIRYQNEAVGMNLRMTEMAAAIGRVQLGRLENWTKQRERNARYLIKELQNIQGLQLPEVRSDEVHSFHQFTLSVDPQIRDPLKQYLDGCGIGCAIYYPTPVHQLPSFDWVESRLPQTERAARSVLSIPVHPFLSEEQLDYIVESVTRFFKAR